MKKTIKITLICILSAIVFCGFYFGTIVNNNAYAAENSVYLGGMPIGIHSESDHFVITDFVNVVTTDGSYSPAQKAGVLKGDIIISVNEKTVKNIMELSEIIENNDNVEMQIRRKNELIKINFRPTTDVRQNKKKAGIMVRNDISGIGTMTYIKPDGEFGALGHPISDSFGNSEMYQNGYIYNCLIYGYNRAENNKAGELIGKITSTTPIGTFFSNTISGIKGNYYEIPSKLTLVPIATRSEVKPGKAYICTTIDGNTPSLYEIEIVKAENQPEEKEKSMVLRVTDPNLLKTTGGILQGMSGSPIIQNGKLVGAVTHVLTAESTMGYGIYIEWMMN